MRSLLFILLATLSAMAQIPGGGLSANAAIEIGLSADARFSRPEVMAGDSLRYLVEVTWKETGIPVMVLAPDSLEFTGLRRVGQSTEHTQRSTDSGLVAKTLFTYRLVALLPGSGKVSSSLMRYRTALHPEERTLYIPASSIDVHVRPTPLFERPWFRWLTILVGTMLLVYGLWKSMAAWKAGRSARSEEKQVDYAGQWNELKSRAEVAESRSLLLQMEALASRWLQESLGPKYVTVDRFDALLDTYLAQRPEADTVGWKKLATEFEHARYGGGRRAPHELREDLRQLAVCLHIKEERQEDG